MLMKMIFVVDFDNNLYFMFVDYFVLIDQIIDFDFVNVVDVVF